MSLLSSVQQTFIDVGDKAITSVDVEYAKSTSSTTAPTSGWNTTAPTWEDGKYIWSRTVTIYNIGSPSTSHAVCITGSQGSTGTSISSITEEYYVSTSKDTQVGGSWITTPPTWSSGKYIWTRSKMVYSNPTSIDYTSPICDSSWEAVNEIQVGGRNLLQKYIRSGNCTEKIDDLSVKIGTTNTGDTYFYLKTHQGLQTGNQYTLSCDASNVPDGCTWKFAFKDLHKNRDLIIDHNGRCYVTFTLNEDINAGECILDDYAITRPSTEVNIVLSNFKLEEGNKSTSYTAAPEDLAIYSVDINFIGSSIIRTGRDYIIAYTKLMKNGEEIDGNIASTISETAPISPSDGTQYYYIDKINRNVTLKQWSASSSSWINATENYEYTYKWSKMDANGALINLTDNNGNLYNKIIYISKDDINVSNVFQCSVFNADNLNIGGAQITCSDSNDTVVSENPPQNPTVGQFWIDIFDSKYILKMFDGEKWIASDNNTVNVFTNKPNINLGDNYLYHKGDLWIIGNDYVPENHSVGELLISIQSRLISISVDTFEGSTYSDGDWVSALSYYDSKLNSLDNNVSQLREHVIIDSNGLKLQATTMSGDNTNFYALLTSSELGFHERTQQGDDVKVVWLSNKSFHSKEAQIENNISIVHEDGNTSGELSLTIGNFKLKTESNGSLSLVVIS